MPPAMTIAEMAIAIGLSAPLNFMIPRFKSDMSSVLPQLQLDCSFAIGGTQSKALQLLIFLRIWLLQFQAGIGIRVRPSEFIKKTYNKHLTNSQE
jgi:hypothetical protein